VADVRRRATEPVKPRIEMSDEALARGKFACGGDYRDRKAPSPHRVCEEQNPSELLLQRKAVKPQSTREVFADPSLPVTLADE